MDGLQFDGLTRSLTKSRRSLLGGALALAGGWLGVADSDARKKHKKKRKKTKKPQPNANGCLNVGAACQSEEEFGPGAACLVYGGICTSFCADTGGAACAPPCNDTAV